MNLNRKYIEVFSTCKVDRTLHNQDYLIPYLYLSNSLHLDENYIYYQSDLEKIDINTIAPLPHQPDPETYRVAIFTFHMQPK
jgi:hypothetical protein